jgi:Pentapeptide repeats (8 copies)
MSSGHVWASALLRVQPSQGAAASGRQREHGHGGRPLDASSHNAALPLILGILMSADLISLVTSWFYPSVRGYVPLFCILPSLSSGVVVYLSFSSAKRSVSSHSMKAAEVRSIPAQLLASITIGLAAPSAESRVAELYRLGKVARDSPELLVPVLATLLDFVHREAGYGPGGKARQHRSISEDVQVALTLIGQLRENGSLPPSLWLDLSWCDLRGARLPSVNFSGADLRYAILDDADLSSANLDSANLMLSSLQRTRLTEASLNMAVLFKANLSDATLRDAKLSDALLAGAILTNADIHRSSLQGAVLTGSALE